MPQLDPEAEARQRIDRQLEQCGWSVQGRREMNISAAPGVAIREFSLTTGEADYMLYADGRAIGVVEAKPIGHTLTGVETQSGKYLDGLPAGLPNYRLPLPFAYESTGEVTQFTNALEPNARSRGVFTFHRPEELVRLVKLDKQVRTRLREMPPLAAGHLWRVQIESIQNLETSLAANRPRALIQMATGSGKTFTAVNRPGKRHLRKPKWNAEKNPEGRWRSFDYDELMKRDKVNLDIFWLKDTSLEDSDDLPAPDVLAQEIADDLQTALEQFTAIAEKVKG